MKIHREGYRPLIITLAGVMVLNLIIRWLAPAGLPVTAGFSLIGVGFLLWFFRSPHREIEREDERLVYAPADGRVVVIEEAEEPEYFQGKRLQLSIFMSPFDVHLNRVPVSGRVSYYHYHAGRYLVAWHPKSSLENERSTLVIDTGSTEILLRQIAGAMARRIRTYFLAGQEVRQGDELGFIKFGSRVDILLPLDTHVEVELGQQVYGNHTVIARLPAAGKGQATPG